MTTSASLRPAVLVSAVNKGGMCGKSIKYIMSQLSSDRQGKGSKGDLKTVLCFFSGLHFEEKRGKRLLGTNCHPWSWFHNFQMPVFNKQDQKLPLTTRRGWLIIYLMFLPSLWVRLKKKAFKSENYALFFQWTTFWRMKQRKSGSTSNGPQSHFHRGNISVLEMSVQLKTA